MNEKLTPLKALEELRQHIADNSSLFTDKRLDIIEKSLKALEIIKKLLDLKISEGRKHYFHIRVGSFRAAYSVSKSEWNILKEVLK